MASFRDRVTAEKKKAFKSIRIDDFGTPFELRALQLLSADEQDTAITLVKALNEFNEASTDVEAFETCLRSFLESVSDNKEACREYFADYDAIDLSLAFRVYQEDTQIAAAKSRPRARR